MANLAESLKNAGAGKTAVLLGTIALLVAGMVVMFLWNQGPDYQILYAGLSPEDSGAVISKLREKKVPYKVDGTNISVPGEKVYELRMELAGEGLPQGGGVGFEIFDKTSFGVTDFVQKINYKRALQGELGRTIAQIKEIEAARVHLAMPDKGVFLDEQKKARASIVIKLKPGKSLNQGQVSSIVHLVANSFENLKPEDITVVDTTGRMWTRGSGDEGAAGLSAAQIDYKKTLERDMETRIQTILEKAVGLNKVVARVSADVDTKQIERTEETYDPDGQVIRSEQRNREKASGAGSSSGVPGVMSNLPNGAQASASSGPQSQSNRQDEIINYEISKVVSHVVEPTGSIKRLTVSVLVDGDYEAVKGEDGKEIKKYVPRTEEEIEKYTGIVKGAVGFSEDRGDLITIVSTPFDSGFDDSAAVEPEKAPLIPSYLVPAIIRYASIAVIAALAILFILRPIIKRLTEEKAALESIEKNFSGTLPIGPGHEAKELPALGHSPDDTLERIKKAVKENPQQVAMVLKGWMKEK